MLGFLPGFAYLGEVHERIAMPRKSHPVQVLAGSIGIAGHQTGIYPLDSPGGWHIIGRTPLRLFDPKNEVPLLMPGDTVQFVSISSHEFTNY
jgi:inhibitor of KinA